MNLSVSTALEDKTATVTIAGELDLGVRETVELAIAEAIDAEGTREVIVDLSALEFIDSSGIGILLKGRRHADKAGVAYRVSAPTGIVRQVLELTGVLEHLSGQPG